MATTIYKVLGQGTSGSAAYFPITTRELTSNVVMLTTGKAHGATIGTKLFVTGLGSPFDGSYLATDTVQANPQQIKYAKTGSNVTSGATTSGVLYTYTAPVNVSVLGKARTGGYATLTTGTDHQLSVGDAINVYINDTTFDGEWIIDEVPSSTTLKYVNLGSDVAAVGVNAGTGSLQGTQQIILYTVPSARSTVISTLQVTNRTDQIGSFSAYLVPSGESTNPIPDKCIITNNLLLESRELYTQTLGYTMAAGDRIIIKSTTPGISFSLFGSELA
jgi:hypothetical protein